MFNLSESFCPELSESIHRFLVEEERMVARMLRLWDFKAHGKPMLVRKSKSRQINEKPGVLCSDLLGLAADDGAKIPRIRVYVGEVLDREDITPMGVDEFMAKMNEICEGGKVVPA